MLLAALPVIWVIRKDYSKGLALAAALIIALPDSLRLSLPGSLPEFTVQRLLLLVVLAFWMRRPKKVSLSASAPFLPWLLLFGLAQAISLSLSIHPSGSFKHLLSYTLEVVLFYVVVSTSLVDRRSLLLLLRSVAVALTGVAIVAALEKYSDVNLSEWLVLGVTDADPQNTTATYPHRILFGYAMAMVAPLLLVATAEEKARSRRWMMWLSFLLVIGACYFSNSRGPWIGLVFGTILVLATGSPATRRKFLIAGALGSLILIARPGVRETVWDTGKSLFETDTVKGNSAAYRKRLWYVAYAEIARSGERTLFGYGGLSTETMDLGHYFEDQGGGSASFLGYTSWDNHYASDLIEFGFVGFLAELLLFLVVMKRLFSLWRDAHGGDRYFLGAIMSGCLVFLFAMSNVWIFSPQLKALFWMLVASGACIGHVNAREPIRAVHRRAEGVLRQPPPSFVPADNDGLSPALRASHRSSLWRK